MRVVTNPRFLSVVIVILFIVSVALWVRVFPDDQTDWSDAALPAVSSAEVTTPISPTIVATAVQLAPLELLAICSGQEAVIDEQSCKKRFEDSSNTLSLGERVIFIPSYSVAGDDLEFSINGDPSPVLFDAIDAAISNLEIGVVHSIRIRRSGEEWSNAVEFQIGLRPPGLPSIYGICADLICAPAETLVAPSAPGTDSLFPLVELVAGLTEPPSRHMWIELMIDADSSRLGCLNCAAAAAAGVVYDDRLEFGMTGIFYNWDLTEFETGEYFLQARLRNQMYVGDWSDKFIFKVRRP
jgi:hypothetical protein